MLKPNNKPGFRRKWMKKIKGKMITMNLEGNRKKGKKCTKPSPT